ncbi:MAG: glycoside hydrolase family protein [Clostridium sp.]|nr:glycoside hydrolase family protein [Clostridium sp.]
MKHLFTILTLCCFGLQTALAGNTIRSIAQVTGSVTLNEDVDYVITGETPFAVTGSINITNTDHAVVILENIRPSQALSYLSFIKINGETAVNDRNCQVKLYAQGTIILPYSNTIRPLTVYSGQNFQGQSVNSFGLEHSGGYMNTLTTAKLNNQIRSFKLKRGYMVTFSTAPGGRGYSRCFIADTEDLEFASLPTVLDRKISSYRVFKWYDADKKGLANNTSLSATQALNVTWCYAFGLGENRGIDCECVPHHIYEDWPSSSACGSVSYSPHMKTNNEPGNSADDHPQTVDQILANWENLMRTGMRLCSPSSHDGSLNHLWAFMDSIDARGWRCDILDIHSYWEEGSFGNLNTWYNRYKRPIWISEWVWGASWNNNGAFHPNRRNDEATYNGTLPILTKINSWPYVERYAYWNSEAWYSNIYRDGQLTKLGQYYATMNPGIGYRKDYEYVPKFVYKKPYDLTATFSPLSRRLDLKWNNPNGEQSDSLYIELQNEQGAWTLFAKMDANEETEQSYQYVYPETPAGGSYTFRIHTFDSDGIQRYTNTASFSVGGAQGEAGFQYGEISFSNTNQITTYLLPFDEEETAPSVFLGACTYNNIDMGLLSLMNSINAKQFRFTPFPWQLEYSTTMQNEETVTFLSVAPGNHTYGKLNIEVGQCENRIGNEAQEITFNVPFEDNVIPVVLVQVVTTSSSYPIMARAYDVTATGFKVKLERQSTVSAANFLPQKVHYMAITPGSTILPNGKMLSAGIATDKIGGSASRYFYLKNPEGENYQLKNPIVVVAPQTHNTDAASLFRLHSTAEESVTADGEQFSAVIGFRAMRQVDKTSGEGNGTAARNGDQMGWVAVSDAYGNTGTGNAIRDITGNGTTLEVDVEGNLIHVTSDRPYTIHCASGISVQAGSVLSPGVYIVKSGNETRKVTIR